MRSRKGRFVAGLLVAALSVGAAPSPSFAVVISTDAVAAAGARDRVATALARTEVQQRLAAYGVDPAQVRDRVDALTDDDVAQLAERLDSLPAGGDGFIGALVFVFLVLLITDIVGLTKIFPFTRSIK